jgi:signal transduction histidine kinase
VSEPPDQRAREARQLELLRQSIEDISSELALEPLLTRLVAGACELIGADDGTVGLYEPDVDVLRTAAVYRMPPGELGSSMRRGQGLAGAVLDSGRTIVARYGDLQRISLPELADNQVIGMPIRWGDELLGMFGIGARPPRRFSDQDIATLELFTRHAAIAIVNARRYANERRRTARFQLIARVASIISANLELDPLLQRAADAIHEVLQYPNVDIPLLDTDDPNTLVIRIRGGSYKRAIRGEDRIPIARGIMGAAVRERRTQRVNDVAGDPRYVNPPGVRPPQAELAVPIILGRDVLGVVNVEANAPFDELDQSSLEIVAGHLAVAINNARLFSRSRQLAVFAERQRLARELHDNVTQILSSMNLLAQTLAGAWDRDPVEGKRRVHRLEQLAQTAFAEMRALLRELQPPEDGKARQPEISRQGRALLGIEQLRRHALPGALTQLLAAMVPEGLELKLDFAGWVPQRLDHEEALYRVCQEAVSNVIRHAHARRLMVAAAVHGDEALVSIADNGRGIASDITLGIGLRSMRERMSALNGALAIAPRCPAGTEIQARLPRADRAPPPA